MALRHPAVLFMGGLHPRKGVADLLEAFSLARETRPDLNPAAPQSPMMQSDRLEAGNRI